MTIDALSDQQLLCDVCAAAIWMTLYFKSPNSSNVKGHSLGPKLKSRCKNSEPCRTGIFPTREKARAAWDELKKGES